MIKFHVLKEAKEAELYFVQDFQENKAYKTYWSKDLPR